MFLLSHACCGFRQISYPELAIKVQFNRNGCWVDISLQFHQSWQLLKVSLGGSLRNDRFQSCRRSNRQHLSWNPWCQLFNYKKLKKSALYIFICPYIFIFNLKYNTKTCLYIINICLISTYCLQLYPFIHIFYLFILTSSNILFWDVQALIFQNQLWPKSFDFFMFITLILVSDLFLAIIHSFKPNLIGFSIATFDGCFGLYASYSPWLITTFSFLSMIYFSFRTIESYHWAEWLIVMVHFHQRELLKILQKVLIQLLTFQLHIDFNSLQDHFHY